MCLQCSLDFVVGLEALARHSCTPFCCCKLVGLSCQRLQVHLQTRGYFAHACHEHCKSFSDKTQLVMHALACMQDLCCVELQCTCMALTFLVQIPGGLVQRYALGPLLHSVEC